MTKPSMSKLSRRERQIMDILHQHGQSSVADVLSALPDPPSYSSVRALLRILEEKGFATHAEDGARYLYKPLESSNSVAKITIQQVLNTFFGGSVERAVMTLMSSENPPSDEELARLEVMIRQARNTNLNDDHAKDNGSQ